GGQAVERALGSDLLKGPDHDVRDQDAEKQRIPPRRERDRQHSEDEQDPVGDGQRVGAEDAGVGAARATARKLAAPLEPSRSLDFGKPRGRDLGAGRYEVDTTARDVSL